jgi:hypothetical protein
VTLTAPLATARAALFGRGPDRAFAAYRARQVLTAVHASELVGYVYTFDPRVTYDVTPAGGAPLFSDVRFTPVVSPKGPSVVGSPVPPDDTGRSAYAFTVDFAGGMATVTPDGGNPVTTSPAFSSGLSDPVPLGHTGYALRFHTGDSGGQWRVTGYLRPVRDAGALVVGLAGLGGPVTDTLFGFGGVEPYATFRNIWTGRDDGPRRLAAFACALVFRTEEARLSGG